MTECKCEFPHQLGDMYLLIEMGLVAAIREKHIIALTNTIQWFPNNSKKQKDHYSSPTTVALVDIEMDLIAGIRMSESDTNPLNPVWIDVVVKDPQNISCTEWEEMSEINHRRCEFVFIQPPALILLAKAAE